MYVKTNWENLPSTNTPTTASNLNNIETGIKDNNDMLLGNKAMGDIIVDGLTGKNMVDMSTFATTTSNGITATYDISTNELTINGTATARTDINLAPFNKMKFKSGTQYTFSSTYVSGSTTENCTIYLQDANYNYQGFTLLLNENNTSFTNSFNADISITLNILRIPNGTTLDNYKCKLQMEKGNTATDYVEHKEYENIDVYSTIEKRIGIWIDGKPLYRRTLLNILGANTNTTLLTDTNIEMLTNAYGVVSYANGWHQIGAYANSNFYSLIQYSTVEHTVSLFGKGYDNKPCRCTIEYTKTTD